GLVSVALVGVDLPEQALTLDQALDEAGRNNIDLALARAGRDDADASVNASYAGVLPRLDLNVGFAKDVFGLQQAVYTVPDLANSTATNLVFKHETVPIPAANFADYTLGMT